MPKLGSYILTSVGWLGTTETQAHMFLCHLRTLKKNQIKTLDNKWALLRSSFRNLGLTADELPAWVLRGHGGSDKHHALFRKWALEDAKVATASTPKGSLTSSQIESFCLGVISKHLKGDIPNSSIDILWALVLRIQSGSGGRHQNVVEPKWSSVGYKAAPNPGQDPVGFVDFTSTKIGHMTGHQAAVASLKSTLFMSDWISSYLFNIWFNLHSADRVSDAQFFFPNVGMKNDHLHWYSPLSGKAHKRACQACAVYLGLPCTAEDLASYSSNCVRRGLAAEVVCQVNELLTQTNPGHGRAPGSRVDLKVYCPKHIILRPGPLFSDTAGIKERAMAFLGEAMQDTKTTLVCMCCGFPKCMCTKCKERCKQLNGSWGMNTAATTSHTCWLAGKLKGRIPKAGPKETADQLLVRREAWAKYGIADLPKWKSTQANGNDVLAYSFD